MKSSFWGDYLSRNYVVGVDLGGTKILTAVADRQGSVLSRVRVATGADLGQDHVINEIVTSVAVVLREAGVSTEAVAAAGIGVPGPLDPQTGVVYLAPNLGWQNLSLGEILGSRLKLPVYVDNDANLAALGECVYGAGQSADNLVYITVSTGVGGGLILGGKIYHGFSGGAGEIGHITLAADGPRCGCGNLGCLEALASGTAIAKRAVALVAEGRGLGILSRAGGDRGGVSARVVAAAASNGDGEAILIMRDAGRYLGMAVAGILNLLNPSVVVLGGGVMQSGSILWEAMLETTRRCALSSALQEVSIVRAALGEEAGVMGALALALEKSQGV